MEKQDRKNIVCYGLGTVGRDMFYSLEANALIYFLSHVLRLPLSIFFATSMVFTVLRIFDALNDPFMGLIVDNGRSKYGKFKPPMLIGALGAAVFYMLLFSDFGLRDWRYVVIFALAYILWDLFFGLNDIAYWSMLPSLSMDQKTREKIGAFAKICANIGLFLAMVFWQPVTKALGGDPAAWFKVALFMSVMMIAFQLFTIFGVKEKRFSAEHEEKVTLGQMFAIFTKNDQLMWVTLSMSLFNIGYMTTTSAAVYYMGYVYGDESKYAILAAIVGVAQITALIIFPLISKQIPRQKFYTLSIGLILIGYVLFYFADQSLALIIIAALILFIGQAFIQLLMLMFLADTVEYGQWKLGRRNESITFSAQPLINKIGGALSMGAVSLALIESRIKVDDVAAETIDANGKLVLKLSMIVLPLLLILISYWVYRKKFKIDEVFYKKILTDLKERGAIEEENSIKG